MLIYRVFAGLPSAAPGEPGHPGYLHRPQGLGRWDNPSLYDIWYLSKSPEGAVAEAFGNLASWSEDMFETPFLSGGRRELAMFSVPDDMSMLDLDDAQNLLDQGMRPTQVVMRNLAYTQARAASIFATRGPTRRRWAGLAWWSYHRPYLTNVALWSTDDEPAPLTLVEVRSLSLRSPEVVETSRMLSKTLH